MTQCVIFRVLLSTSASWLFTVGHLATPLFWTLSGRDSVMNVSPSLAVTDVGARAYRISQRPSILVVNPRDLLPAVNLRELLTLMYHCFPVITLLSQLGHHATEIPDWRFCQRSICNTWFFLLGADLFPLSYGRQTKLPYTTVCLNSRLLILPLLVINWGLLAFTWTSSGLSRNFFSRNRLNYFLLASLSNCSLESQKRKLFFLHRPLH